MNFYANAAKELISLSASTAVLNLSARNQELALVHMKMANTLINSGDIKYLTKSAKSFNTAMRKLRRAQHLRNLAEKIHEFPTK